MSYRRSTRSQSRLSGTVSDNNISSGTSSGTEDYELPRVLRNQSNNHELIVLNDSEGPQNIVVNDDDDDVIMIPQQVETIDLCTQTPTVVPLAIPPRWQNQIIDITGSPVAPAPAIADTAIPLIQGRTRSNSAGRNTSGPSRNRQNNENRTSPYSKKAGTSRTSPKNNSTKASQNLDESYGNLMSIQCPICLESVKEREPVATGCGHVFCKECIKAAFRVSKVCPMCKKRITGAKQFIPLFI